MTQRGVEAAGATTMPDGCSSDFYYRRPTTARFGAPSPRPVHELEHFNPIAQL